MAYTDKKYYDRQCLIVVNDDRGLRNDEIDVFTRYANHDRHLQLLDIVGHNTSYRYMP